MVLLTSSAISVAISSLIIGTFTFLLFLSGYLLQQQSVRSIRAALHPPTPQKPTLHPFPSLVAGNLVSVSQGDDIIEVGYADDGGEAAKEEDSVVGRTGRPFGRPADTSGNVQQMLKDKGGSIAGKQAYVQLVSKPNPSDICSALLFFQTLSSRGSNSPDRVFVYPRSWDRNSPSRKVATALKLLRESRKPYNLVLYAIDTTDAWDRYPSNTRLLGKATPHLIRYEKVLYLHTPGLLLDLDQLERAFVAQHPPASFRTQPVSHEGGDWILTRLSPSNPELPPALLVTSQYLPSGLTSIKSHIPAPSIENSIAMSATSNSTAQGLENPGYIYFQKGKSVSHEHDSNLFQSWKRRIQAVCEGIDLSD